MFKIKFSKILFPTGFSKSYRNAFVCYSSLSKSSSSDIKNVSIKISPRPKLNPCSEKVSVLRVSPTLHLSQTPNTGLSKPVSSFLRFASTDCSSVSYSDLKEITKYGKAVIIDVRGKKETWRTGTIPGSICIPLPELESALNMTNETFQKTYFIEKPTSDDQIVFVCRRGERSFKALQQAKEMGYNKSKSYDGGFLGWFNEERLSSCVAKGGGLGGLGVSTPPFGRFFASKKAFKSQKS